jgi:dihydroorotase/N-acyl-D-amino-acid deacylase
LLLLRQATILDGSASPPYCGDILIDGRQIASVGTFAAPADAETIDCTNLVAAPGFIDIHSHSDLQVLEKDRAKADQGVTTEVVGNCGFSPYPFIIDRQPLQEFANGILYGSDDTWGWRDADEYLQQVMAKAQLASVLSLVGHGSLRVAHMGHRQDPPSAAEMDAMTGTLSDCLSQGAAGLSTGLMYAPGSSAQQDELVQLCKVVARHGKVYATHMRSYSDQLLESIDEQVLLARTSGCRLQISHLQAVGARNWDKQQRALERLEQARLDGVDVEFDSYPYLAGSTVATQLLPQKAVEGGTTVMLKLLANLDERKAIAQASIKQIAQRWSDIFIASVGSQRNQHLVGLSFEDLAQQRDVAPIDAIFDLLIEEKGVVNILSFNQSEANLRMLLTHPLCTVISDGFYVKGRPHPRLYGTFPCLLGEIVRERGWLSLAEAVHKITGKPAERFGMKNRGRIAPGNAADVVVFDPVRISGRATYENPKLPPDGISLILREGRPN